MFWVDAYNPFYILRTRLLHMTQEQVATLCDTTVQYIRRVEQGSISNPFDRMTRAVWDIGGEVDKRREVEWLFVVTEINRLARDTRLEAATKRPQLKMDDGGYGAFEKAVGEWWEFWLYAKRYNAFPIPAPTTVSHFCRRLGVHVYVVQHYLSRVRNNPNQPVPESVYVAINQTQQPSLWFRYLNQLAVSGPKGKTDDE